MAFVCGSCSSRITLTYTGVINRISTEYSQFAGVLHHTERELFITLAGVLHHAEREFFITHRELFITTKVIQKSSNFAEAKFRTRMFGRHQLRPSLLCLCATGEHVEVMEEAPAHCFPPLAAQVGTRSGRPSTLSESLF